MIGIETRFRAEGGGEKIGVLGLKGRIEKPLTTTTKNTNLNVG